MDILNYIYKYFSKNNDKKIEYHKDEIIEFSNNYFYNYD